MINVQLLQQGGHIIGILFKRDLPAIAVIAVDRERASRAGALKQKHSLGYADAFAAELAIDRGAWLVTADPAFEKVGKALSVYSLPRYEK